jgi:hypothetical protein
MMRSGSGPAARAAAMAGEKSLPTMRAARARGGARREQTAQVGVLGHGG